MNAKSWLTPVLIAACLSSTPALAMEKKAAADPNKAKALARYKEDKKLCAEEGTSAARMQCLRDAKAEYEKALAETPKASQAAESKQICVDCGKVISVKAGEKEGEGSAMGVIGGGVVGALLGNQVGQGTGKDLATIAGAAGGAYAGNKIEKNMKSTKFWTVNVRFENGDERSFNFDHDPGFISGDPVKRSGDSIVRR